LRAADSDEFRDAVRDAVVAKDAAALAELAARPPAGQPAGVVALLGENKALPVEARRRLLGAAVSARSGNLGLLIALGRTYPIEQKEGVEERARWFQAAAAAAPDVPATHNNLGIALTGKGDLGAAVAAFREAVRLDPKYAAAHSNLGNALREKKDLDG